MDMAAGGTRVISRGIFLSCPMLRHTQAPGGGDTSCGVPWGGLVLVLGSVEPQLLSSCWESSRFIYHPEKGLKVYWKGKEETSSQGPRAKPVHMAPEDQSRECAQTSLIPTRALCSPGMKSVPSSFPCFHHHHRSLQNVTWASSEQEGFAEAPRSHPNTPGFSSYRREALLRSKILRSSYEYLKQKFLFIVPVCRGRCFLGVSLTCGSTLQPASTSAAELGLREAHEGQVLWAAAAL